MAISSDVRDQLALRFEVLLPHLNERQRRLLLAAEARLLGHGGVRAVAQVAGMSETTVRRGVFELEEGQDPFPDGRARREGGGRRSIEELDAGLVPALLALVEPDERGDPESPLRWTTKSLRHLAGELSRQGHPVSAPTVGRLLRGAGFSLQANAKTLEGAQHPDRDAQFRYINEQVKDHQASGEPVISVDTKKREQLGWLPMAGREWRPKGEPVGVEDHSSLERHAAHGAWNYTLHPAAGTPSVSEGTAGQRSSPARRRQEMLAKLNDERLTGMTSSGLARLRAALAPLQAARAQQRYSQQRGGRARRATGNVRARPLFDDAARLLLTLLYQRQVCCMNVLADLLEVTATCIGDLVKETREILEDHGHDPGVAPVRFTTCDALLAFADGDLRPARATVTERLSHPALTGLTQHELHDLTSRLAARQAAQTERLTYQRRGGPRQPGTRGGVFHQKISNSERTLLTLLYQRRLCTLDVLADALGDVSRTAVGNVIRETLPLLRHEDRLPLPAPTRYRTAAELLAAGARNDSTN